MEMLISRIAKVGALLLALGAPLPALQAATATNILIETTADDTVANGLCSLREALTNANNNAATYPDCLAGGAGPAVYDILNFTVGGTVTLLSPLPTITDDTIIYGWGVTIRGPLPGSLLTFTPPSTARFLEITNMTLTNTGSGGDGAAVKVSAGTFKASGVNFNNSVTSGRGGALYLGIGTTSTISSSYFRTNQANNSGGAIYADSGATLTLSDVEIDGNKSLYGHGGGIYQMGGSLTMSHGSLINNKLSTTTAVWGGAVYVANASVKLNNITVANNTGGSLPGLYFYQVNGGLANVTVAGNKASVVPTTPVGVGIDATAGATGFKIRNSIIANNKNSSGATFNCVLSGVLDDGYNIEDSSGCFSDPTSKLTPNFFVLGSLALHGGTIQTMPIDLLDGAVDAGNPDGCRDMNGALLTRDARTASAVRSADGDNDGTKRCDIGAYEFAALGAMELKLDKSTTREGETNPAIRIERRGELLATTSRVATANITATASSDYTAVSQNQTWNAGDTLITLPLSVTNDSLVEADETLRVDLSTTDAGVDLIANTQTLTITDNDLVVSIDSASSPTMNEDSTAVTYKVRVSLDKTHTSPVTVPFTLGGSAVQGSDYTMTAPATTTLTIAAGTAYADITLVPSDDEVIEDSESITVTLGTPSIGMLGATTSHTMTLWSEDTAPKLTAPTSTVQVEEDTSTGIMYTTSDADGDSVTVTIKTQPSHGSAEILAGISNIYYTPEANYHGPDSLVLTLTDGTNPVDYTVNINVNPVNDAPQITEGDMSEVMMSEDGSPTPFALTLTASDVDNDTLTWSVSAPAHGTATVSNGVVSYTPAANYNGPDSFNVAVSDGNGGTADHAVGVTVEAVADLPVVGNDTVTTDEDAAVTFNVLANDSDPDGGTLTIITVDMGLASGASVVWGTGGSVTYTPPANFSGSDHFNYTVKTSSGQVNGEVFITVTAVNDAPVLADGPASVTMSEDGNPTPFALTLAATDVDNDPLGWSMTSPLHGIASVDDQGKVSYTPNANFAGVDSFIVTVSDGNGGIAYREVTVTVESVNDLPVAGSDSASGDEDATIASINVLGNDSDVEGDALSIVMFDAVTLQGGTVMQNADNTFSYTPAANFNGSDAFSYSVSDGNGGTTVAAVAISIVAVNDLPVLGEGSTSTITMSEDGSPIAFARSLHASDVDGDALGWSVGMPASHGVASVSNGVVDYSPAADFSGSDSFTIQVADGNGGIASNVVVVTVQEVNDAPLAVNDSTSINEDTQYDPAFDFMSGINVLGNDSDVEGDVLFLLASDATTAMGGTVMQNADGTLNYIPAANFNGSDSFSYTVNDGRGGSATATVAVTVVAVNDAPVISEGSTSAITMSEDGSPIAFARTLHASDVDGDALSWSVGMPASHGTASVSNGVVGYTPSANFNGTDSFTIQVADGNGGVVSNVVVVTVQAVNDVPLASNDSGSGSEDTTIVVNVRANDSDADGDALAIAAFDAVTVKGGMVAKNADNSLSYTPPANFSGSDSFSYTLSDGKGGSATATVAITISALNDVPVISEGSASSVTMSENGVPLAFAATLHATDPDSDPLAWSIATLPAHGSASVTAGVLAYTPTSGYVGSDSFTVKVSDGKGGTASHTVSVTIQAVNEAPLALDSTLTLVEDTASDIMLSGSDADGDLLGYSLVSEPGHGTVTLSGDTVHYVPQADYYGSDSFTYVVNDGIATSNLGTVTLDIAAANDAPSLTLSASTLELTAGESSTIEVTIIDVDGLEGAILTAGSVEGLGTVTVSDGVVNYTANEAGSDTLTITVTDAGGMSQTVAVSVTTTKTTPPATSSGGGGGGGAISWWLLLGMLPFLRRQRAA